MKTSTNCCVQLILLSVLCLLFNLVHSGYLGAMPPGCDQTAALECEYNFLLCKLFKGPANDKNTLCTCASEFYGRCLRLAGVSLSMCCTAKFAMPYATLYVLTAVRNCERGRPSYQSRDLHEDLRGFHHGK